MAQKRWFLMMMVAAVFVFGCGSEKDSAGDAASQKKEPDVITVQHVLIGFQGSLPGKPVSRTREEAQVLAEELFKKAKAGEDFDALVKQYTDDSHPGIYSLANNGIPADLSKGIYARSGMIPAFGNVGFALRVGDVGMAAHDAERSPYGWHIIKRIK